MKTETLKTADLLIRLECWGITQALPEGRGTLLVAFQPGHRSKYRLLAIRPAPARGEYTLTERRHR